MADAEYCFACWPGGPVTPPPCLRCGSRTGYYTSGVCRRCHRDGDPGVDSCLDCYAWGATRHHTWLCVGCKAWRRDNSTLGQCPSCGQRQHLGTMGACRLCYKQASYMRPPDGKLDIVAANQHGQQLFIANLFLRRGMRRPQPAPRAVDPTSAARHGCEQLLLFTMRRDLSAHGRVGLHLRADPTRAAALDVHARAVATELGWSARQLEDTCYGLRIVLGIQDYPHTPVNASDVELLREVDLPVWTVLRVLARAGLLREDRTPAFDAWFTDQIRGLPEPMSAELTTWFDILKNGSQIPPRRRPRSETTIRLHLQWALPILRDWANAGHTSLRTISREHVLDALPPSGNPRSQAGQGLKSICRLLKARKILFTDPTSRVKTGYHQSNQPMPVDVDLLRAALHSDDPARAALVALMAFHGLRTGQLQRLELTGIRDGRLHIDGRIIILAEPVRDRIRAYLDHRNQRWPHATSPYVFLTRHTGSRHQQASARWIWLTIGPGLSAAAVREDRILDEALATGGDVRRLADLFGLSIQAGTRYTTTIAHPDLRNTQ